MCIRLHGADTEDDLDAGCVILCAFFQHLIFLSVPSPTFSILITWPICMELANSSRAPDKIHTASTFAAIICEV